MVSVHRGGGALATVELSVELGELAGLEFLAEEELLAVQVSPDGVALSRGTLKEGLEPWGFLANSRRVGVRLGGRFLTLCDDRGRLLVQDLRAESTDVSLRL